jgi:hypothetical protein
MSLKNPVTRPGIDPGTVRLVAQRLNHYATPGPTSLYIPPQNTIFQHTSSAECKFILRLPETREQNHHRQRPQPHLLIT